MSGYGAVKQVEEDPLLRNDDGDTIEIQSLSERVKDVVKMYWHLGFIGFGGPAAHIGILRDHLVVKNDWIKEEEFTELFALSQGLPGPTSTQLLISTAVTHGGPLGGFVAFLLWMLPAFTVVTASGLFLYDFVDPSHPPIWLLGIAPAAIALVFKAFAGFVSKLDRLGVGLAMFSGAVAVMINGDLNIPPTSSQVVYPALLIVGATAAWLDSRRAEPTGTYPYVDSKAKVTDAEKVLEKKIGIPIWVGVCIVAVWAGTLILTTVLVQRAGEDVNPYLEIFNVFFQIGSEIFGGGIVLLPLSQNVVIPEGWLNNDQFFHGLAITQSMPGPFFNFSAFMGAVYMGLPGAVLAALGLFGPGFILIFAMVSFWTILRRYGWFKAVLKGLNATAIGLIGAGCVFLYEGAIKTAADNMVFIICGGLVTYYGFSAPATIFTGLILGVIFSHAVLNVGQKSYDP